MWGGTELLQYVDFLFPKLWPSAPAMIYEKYLPLYLVFGLIILPCTFVRELSGFRIMAWACLFLELLSILCVLMSLVRRLEISSFDPDGAIKLFTSDWKVVFDAFFNFNTVLFVHPFIPFVMQDLERPTVSRCIASMRIATTISFVLCLLGQFLSFSLFTDAERFTDIFCTLDTNRGEVVVGLASNALISLCSTGMFAYFSARTLAGAILGDSVNDRVANFSAGLVIVSFCCFMMFMEDRHKDAIDAIANFCFILLEYAVPPLFYLYEFRFRRITWSILALTALIGGLGIGLIACGLTVEGTIALFGNSS
jgi:hypothetical protein